MKLYVVRHGETPSNLTGIVSGRSEESLTENGRAQARKVNRELEGVKFDAVFVSPMRRTLETAEIIVPEYEFKIEPRIAERDLGTLRDYTIDELWQRSDWNSLDLIRTKEGAETFLSGLTRVQDFLADLRKTYPADAKILLITHSFISRCLWTLDRGVSPDLDYKKFHHKNDEIAVYNI